MNTEYLNIVLKDINFYYRELESNPYWSYLKHNQYRSFYESYIRLLDTFGNYFWWGRYTEELDKALFIRNNSPYFALYRGIYEQFKNMLEYIYDKDNIESTKQFKEYYLPSMKYVMQFIKKFLDRDNENLYVRIPSPIIDPTYLTTYKPKYVYNGTDITGYKVCSDNSYVPVAVYTNSQTQSILNNLNIQISKTKDKHTIDWLNACKRDLTYNSSRIFMHEII